MVYMGSKRRIATDILKIMVRERHKNQVFYDLFAGGFNLVCKVKPPRVANDFNKYIIGLFKELQKPDFKFPEHITEEKYKEVQENKDSFPDWLVGYIGFSFSFGSKFFGGFARFKLNDKSFRNEKIVNDKTKKSLSIQKKQIQGISLYNLSYDEVPLEPNSIIYCDPPYRDTTSYVNTESFNHDKFYDWCREKHREGHKIFVSEYYMPDDFICIWKKDINCSLNGEKATEKLYTLSDDKYCASKITGLFF